LTESAYITDLVHRSRSGDAKALDTLFAVVRPNMYAYALKICKFNLIAEDALQDAMLYAHLHFHQLRNPEAFLPWLRSIVKRSAWQTMNNASKSAPIESLALSTAAIEYEFESTIEAQLESASILDCVNSLSDNLRSAVMLRYFSSRSEYTDIATILDIPIGTVRSRLNQAKKQLRKLWDTSSGIDIPEQLRRESEEWNDFYRELWEGIYDNLTIRSTFFDHFIPDLKLHFTTGKQATGRSILEHEINDDLHFGSRFKAQSIMNIGNDGIIEGIAVNSKEYPDRCPPYMTMVVKRTRSRAVEVSIHNSH
jgi:RNA polymerase sigma factor (sigma-70 family)